MNLFKSIMCITVFFFTISSCKKNNDESDMSSKIIGRWNLTAFESKDYTDGNYSEGSSGFSNGEYFEFKADGTFETNLYGSDLIHSTWEIKDSGKKIILGNDMDYYLADNEMTIRDVSPHLLILVCKEVQGNNYHEVTIFMDNL